MDTQKTAQTSFDIGSGRLLADLDILTDGRAPMDAYWSSERFAAERAVFGKVWLNLGEAAEIPDPGNWITREIPIRSVSSILARGADMKIRAFHNICAHCGMKLVWDKQERDGKFADPCHGRVYDATGRLINLPDDDNPGNGLTPMKCDIWEGLIFVNLDPDSRQSLADYMAPISGRIKNIPFESCPYTVRLSSMVDANWKLCIEAQSETYHVTSLHRRTVVKMMVTPGDPFAHALACEPLGAHGMTAAPRNPDFNMAPGRLVQNFAFSNAAQMVVGSMTEGVKAASLAAHPDINRSKSNGWGNDQYIVFPHFIFQLAHGGWWLHRFWPVTPDKTLWELVYHFEKPQNLRNKFALAYTMVFGRDAVIEDNVALTQQQPLMRGRGKSFVQFGEQENMCKHLAAVGFAAAENIGRSAA